MALLFAVAIAPARAAPSPQPEPDADTVLLPGGTLYAPYLADPHEQRISLEWLQLLDEDIPFSGDDRFGLHLGGQIGLLRGHARGYAWQLSVEAGYRAQFDNDARQDNIGWDGDYGLSLEWRAHPRHAGKLFLLHTSSHIGDEYIERTGSQRINYTREELGLAMSWMPRSRWRAYFEAGWAYDLRNHAVQDPWRGQGGLEYLAPGALWGGQLGWFAGADLAVHEERDWRADTALTLGVWLPGAGRGLQFDLHYVNGRPFLGEFFQSTEQYLALRLSTRL